MSIPTQLASIQSADPKDRASLYHSLLATLVSQIPSAEPSLPHAVREVLAQAVAESTGLVTSRQILQDFISLLAQAKSGNGMEEDRVASVVRELWEVTLAVIETRTVAFEDQISKVREMLGTLYEEAEEWEEAAKMLQGIPLDSGHRIVSDEFKLRIYIQIVRLLLESDDAVAAESYLNRAALLILDTTPTDQQIHFKSSQARILDQKRSFLLAAQKYSELSHSPEIHPDVCAQLLQQAVTCTVLASAGPQRSRMLATLYKDDRLASTPSLASANDILQKMYLGRILRMAQVVDFAATLAPHQLARLADGSTVLDKAVTEHNLLAASSIYVNIGFEELATLLGVTPAKAEKTACRMMAEKNLKGRIDQIERRIEFRTERLVSTWDAQVAGLCHHVDGVVESLTAK
ncbi:COP9 signalosome complex subunit 4 [Thoreauomyces humboldtii]|nr:COP9 signalosome complex subunit 4 [Thoreauomyces humboldtii]